MTESITITLPKKMSLVMRITEAARQISEWLLTLDAALHEERGKLHLTKCELKNNEFRYHYSISQRKGASVGKINLKKKDDDPETLDVPSDLLQGQESLTNLPADL